MEFTDQPGEAMTWPTLADAGRELDEHFQFGARHQLLFIKVDRNGQPGRGRSWAVAVSTEGKSLGYLRRYTVRRGEAVFP